MSNMGKVSDGYHTFDELYEHRHVLFAALVNSGALAAWKSKLHADGTMFEGGWFIAGIETPSGMVTYHIPIAHWELFRCPELERAPQWDGHTSADCVERLKNYCAPKNAESQKPAHNTAKNAIKTAS